MNKTEYLAALAARSEWMGQLTEIALDGNANSPTDPLKLYDIALLVQQPNGTFQVAKQGFYVRDEGEPGETVYPVNQERQSEAEPAFKSQLETFLGNQLSATRIKITVDSRDDQHEFAVVTAYELVSNQIVPKRYFVAKDAQGDPFIRVYVPG